MSIKRIKDFPEGSGSLTSDDVFIFMDDPSGSSVTRKVNLSSIKSFINSGINLSQYALLNSPNFSGIPTAPTANSGTNSTQIATTSFVRSEVSNLVNSAPAALDTLGELAAALGNDANFSTTILNSLSGKANLSGATFTGNVIGPSGNFTSLTRNNVVVSVSGHTHNSSDITDFNTSVSGLLPVKNVLGSGNINVTSSSEVFTISSSGLVKSDISGIAGASGVNNLVQISQANYDALVSKDPNTVYFIV